MTFLSVSMKKNPTFSQRKNYNPLFLLLIYNYQLLKSDPFHSCFIYFFPSTCLYFRCRSSSCLCSYTFSQFSCGHLYFGFCLFYSSLFSLSTRCASKSNALPGTTSSLRPKAVVILENYFCFASVITCESLFLV